MNDIKVVQLYIQEALNLLIVPPLNEWMLVCPIKLLLSQLLFLWGKKNWLICPVRNEQRLWVLFSSFGCFYPLETRVVLLQALQQRCKHTVDKNSIAAVKLPFALIATERPCPVAKQGCVCILSVQSSCSLIVTTGEGSDECLQLN